MVQESFLKEDDVASLLKDCKHENKLCLTLEATKLINKLRTEKGWRLRVMNGLTNTISTGYWFARGRASIEMEGEAHDLFRDWRSGTWSNPRLARLGLVILAEQYLEGCDDFTHNSHLSVLKKLDCIMSQSGGVEAALTPSPRDWWGPDLMSEKLSTVVNLVMLQLFTNTIPGLVTRPSPQFSIVVLLPKLSSILLSPAIPDIDISTVMARLINIIKSIPRHKVCSLLKTVYHKLQPDMKAVFRSYVD